MVVGWKGSTVGLRIGGSHFFHFHDCGRVKPTNSTRWQESGRSPEIVCCSLGEANVVAIKSL